MNRVANNHQFHRLTQLIRRSFSTLLLLTLSTSIWANEAATKIYITADKMNMNIETGSSVYTGNVKISQGKLLLTGDKVTLEPASTQPGKQNNEGKQLERLIVIGNPARYNHITDAGEPIEAESEHMVYTASSGTLVMTKNAHLKQPDNELSSQKIIYNTEKKTVIAGSDSKPSGGGSTSQGKQRVNITLTPKSVSTE